MNHVLPNFVFDRSVSSGFSIHIKQTKDAYKDQIRCGDMIPLSGSFISVRWNCHAPFERVFHFSEMTLQDNFPSSTVMPPFKGSSISVRWNCHVPLERVFHFCEMELNGYSPCFTCMLPLSGSFISLRWNCPAPF